MLNWIREFRSKRYVRALQNRGLKLGQGVYLNDGFFLDPSHCHLIEIQDRVVFGPRVQVFAHDASSLKVIGKTKIARVCLKTNCFIGAGSIILPGSEIGENSILAAGSVLHGVVPDEELWGGVPARKIMTLSEYREKLLALQGIDFSQVDYCSPVLTEQKREEMLRLLSSRKIGFMK